MAIIKEKCLPKLCTNTITDFDALKVALARIREQDYSHSLEETDIDAWVASNRSIIKKVSL